MHSHPSVPANNAPLQGKITFRYSHRPTHTCSIVWTIDLDDLPSPGNPQSPLYAVYGIASLWQESEGQYHTYQRMGGVWSPKGPSAGSSESVEVLNHSKGPCRFSVEASYRRARPEDECLDDGLVMRIGVMRGSDGTPQTFCEAYNVSEYQYVPC